MAMLRVGDAIYLDGTEMLLLGAVRERDRGARAGTQDGGDPRMLLRGVGGQYHGRSFTLERPRIVGRGPEADIPHRRSGLPRTPRTHRSAGRQGGEWRGLPAPRPPWSTARCCAMRSCARRPGGVSTRTHRFVVEAPAARPCRTMRWRRRCRTTATLDHAHLQKAPKGTARRLPWLLLAGLLIAGALSALLLFGSPG
jgi:hypothetical protein